MKKALVLALSLTLAGFASQAQSMAAKPASAQEKANGPQIQFDEMKYDFGSVAQGGTVEHVFKFKNVGTAPLVISNIGVSCGCTTPSWTKEPVMPGKTGTVMAKFNSTGKMGMQNKVLTIESNSAAGNAMVSLVGEVKDASAMVDSTPMKATESAAADDMSNGKEKVKTADSKMKMKKKS